MLWKRISHQELKRKPTLRGKWETVFSGRHTDNFPKETRVVSVILQWPLATVTPGQRGKRRSSSPASHSKAKQSDGEIGDKEENSDKRSQVLCRYKICFS